MHCMVDIETLDTAATAVIVSIGAVLFDPYDANAPMEQFYSVLTLDDQIYQGRTISGATIAWWMGQSDAARGVFAVPVTNEHADAALLRFNTFANRAQGVWGNGSDFDNAVLANANVTFRLKGWGYSRNRCFRTLKNLALPREFVKPEREGTHHNALDDAIYQAKYLQAIVKATEIRI